MKKRIIASTMASVMAISTAATALVASADVKDYTSEYVTKAQLKKFLEDKEIDDLVNGGVEEFGSVSAEKFQKAIDFANAVVEDLNATAEDATVAFQMVKAAKDNLRQHTKEELQALVEELRPLRETKNRLNEDDEIYDPDDWSDFVDKFDLADDCKESDDLFETTDAWEELNEVKSPEALKQKTKREIDAARNAYIAALENEFKYQPWERGTVEGSKVSDYNGLEFAWGVLYAHIASAKTDLMDAYAQFTKRKGINVTTDTTIVAAVNAMNNAVSVLDGFTSNLENKSSETAVNKLLAEYHGQLVYTYNASEALAVAQNFVTVVDSDSGVAKFVVNGDEKTVTKTIAGTWTAVTASKKTYWDMKDSDSKMYKPLGSKGSVDGTKAEREYTSQGPKLLDADLKIKSDKTIYFLVDKNSPLPNGNYKIENSSGTYFYKAAPTPSSTQELKTMRAGTTWTISDYIEVSTNIASANVNSTKSKMNAVMDKYSEAKFKDDGKPTPKTDKGLKFFWNNRNISSFRFAEYASSKTDGHGVKITEASLPRAMTLYNAFVAANRDQRGIMDLDNKNEIPHDLAVGKSNTKAWKLLYNYMKYALEDEFKASATKQYKKKDVESIKKDAEKLLADTVETSLFQASHNQLVVAVNNASAWLKLANADGNRYYEDYKTEYNNKNSTAMCKEVKDAYDQLKKEYDAFLYSYGEIVDQIAAISKKVDSGELGDAANKTLKADLIKVAEAFLNVDDVYANGGTLADCGLFRDDGRMNKNNRLYTYGAELDSLNFNGTPRKIVQSNKSDKKNYKHYVMQTAYEKLLKDYAAATKTPASQIVEDLNGSGGLDLGDVSMLLQLVVDAKGAVAKHDYTGDSKVDFADVQWLLDKWAKQA